MKNLSILVILVLIVSGFVTSGCAKKEKSQRELQKKFDFYLKELEEIYKSYEPFRISGECPKIIRKLQKIAEKNNPQIIPILIEVIKNKEVRHEVRYDMGKVLGNIASPEVIPILTDILKDEDEVTRNSAIRALCYCNNEEAVEVLIKELKDERVRADILWQMLLNATKDNLIKWSRSKKLKVLLTEIAKEQGEDYTFAEGLLEDMEKKK